MGQLSRLAGGGGPAGLSRQFSEMSSCEQHTHTEKESPRQQSREGLLPRGTSHSFLGTSRARPWGSVPWPGSAERKASQGGSGWLMVQLPRVPLVAHMGTLCSVTYLQP